MNRCQVVLSSRCLSSPNRARTRARRYAVGKKARTINDKKPIYPSSYDAPAEQSSCNRSSTLEDRGDWRKAAACGKNRRKKGEPNSPSASRALDRHAWTFHETTYESLLLENPQAYYLNAPSSSQTRNAITKKRFFACDPQQWGEMRRLELPIDQRQVPPAAVPQRKPPRARRGRASRMLSRRGGGSLGKLGTRSRGANEQVKRSSRKRHEPPKNLSKKRPSPITSTV